MGRAADAWGIDDGANDDLADVLGLPARPSSHCQRVSIHARARRAGRREIQIRLIFLDSLLFFSESVSLHGHLLVQIFLGRFLKADPLFSAQKDMFLIPAFFFRFPNRSYLFSIVPKLVHVCSHWSIVRKLSVSWCSSSRSWMKIHFFVFIWSDTKRCNHSLSLLFFRRTLYSPVAGRHAGPHVGPKSDHLEFCRLKHQTYVKLSWVCVDSYTKQDKFLFVLLLENVRIKLLIFYISCMDQIWAYKPMIISIFSRFFCDECFSFHRRFMDFSERVL